MREIEIEFQNGKIIQPKKWKDVSMAGYYLKEEFDEKVYYIPKIGIFPSETGNWYPCIRHKKTDYYFIIDHPAWFENFDGVVTIDDDNKHCRFHKDDE